jgi:HK97 gp10 family phage protein
VTGGKDLKSSILVRSVSAKERESDVEVAVGPSTHAFWGKFQEHGTVHHGPQPFMRPAWDSSAIPALNEIKETLADEIKKTAKRAEAKARREIAKMK